MPKSTHIAILLFFAITFTVFYLYFTIRDVRKLQVEVKKLQNELGVVKALSATVGQIQSEMQQLSVPIIEVAPSADQAEVESSVDTAEIRNILDADADADDVEAANTEAEVKEEPEAEDEAAEEEPAPTLNPTTLKQLKLDELKELCKERGLSSKGNKNELLARIFESLGLQ